MKELDAIVAEVKEALAAKGKEIEAAGYSVIKPVTDAYLMRVKEVVSFERSTLNVLDDSTFTTLTMSRYRNDAHELLTMISRLVV